MRGWASSTTSTPTVHAPGRRPSTRPSPTSTGVGRPASTARSPPCSPIRWPGSRSTPPCSPSSCLGGGDGRSGRDRRPGGPGPRRRPGACRRLRRAQSPGPRPRRRRRPQRRPGDGLCDAGVGGGARRPDGLAGAGFAAPWPSSPGRVRRPLRPARPPTATHPRRRAENTPYGGKTAHRRRGVRFVAGARERWRWRRWWPGPRSSCTGWTRSGSRAENIQRTSHMSVPVTARPAWPGSTSAGPRVRRALRYGARSPVCWPGPGGGGDWLRAAGWAGAGCCC